MTLPITHSKDGVVLFLRLPFICIHVVERGECALVCVFCFHLFVKQEGSACCDEKMVSQTLAASIIISSSFVTCWIFIFKQFSLYHILSQFLYPVHPLSIFHLFPTLITTPNISLFHLLCPSSLIASTHSLIQGVYLSFSSLPHSPTNSNPNPGVVINRPGGPNVYPGVLKDYTGDEVTPENFLKVLQGDAEGLRGIGSGRVLQSGPNDRVFINLVDHGAPGIFAFPEEYLNATDFANALISMHKNQKFHEVSCHALIKVICQLFLSSWQVWVSVVGWLHSVPWVRLMNYYVPFLIYFIVLF